MSYLKVFVTTTIPLFGGLASAFQTRQAVESWYLKIKKPWWNPPKYAFGPVWTTLYLMMGYSSHLVLEKLDLPVFEALSHPAMYWYTIQLGLNWAWSPLFFNKYWGLALVDVVAMTGSIFRTIQLFDDISPQAAYLLYPYLGWVMIATSLNLYIWWYNDPKEKLE